MTGYYEASLGRKRERDDTEINERTQTKCLHGWKAHTVECREWLWQDDRREEEKGGEDSPKAEEHATFHSALKLGGDARKGQVLTTKP